MNGTDLQIRRDDLRGPEIRALLEEHLAHMRAISPPESVHALDLERLRRPEIAFWTVWDQQELLGCGALKRLGEHDGEIKSMRTASRHQRRGVARACASAACSGCGSKPARPTTSCPRASSTRTSASAAAGRSRITARTRTARSCGSIFERPMNQAMRDNRSQFVAFGVLPLLNALALFIHGIFLVTGTTGGPGAALIVTGLAMVCMLVALLHKQSLLFNELGNLVTAITFRILNVKQFLFVAQCHVFEKFLLGLHAFNSTLHIG